MTGNENPGFLPTMSWEIGAIFEAVSYDTELARQGKILFEVVDVEAATRKGRWIDINVISVEDENLLWWLKRGPGSKYDFDVKLHICTGLVSRCKEMNVRKLQEFHTDAVRGIDVDDVRSRRVLWWSAGENKRRFEDWRKTLLGDGKGSSKEKKNKPGEVTPDDLDFSLSEAEEAAERALEDIPGEKPKSNPLKKKLDALKAAVKDKKGDEVPAKKPRKKRTKEKVKTPRGEKKDEASEKEEKDGDEVVGLASSSSDGRRPKSAKAGWFGRFPERSRSPVRLKPARRDEKEKERKRKRKEEKEKGKKSDSSTDSKEKRRAKKRRTRDRGPFGSGRVARYGDEDGGESDHSSESVFRGGVPEKKAQQLMLLEYSEKKPGRLAARLLQKMELLLSRAGTPFDRTGMRVNSTPPVALPYLLTVIYPTYKEKLGVKLTRELRTLATAMDFIASGQSEKAADVIGQRMKALELALADQGWVRAQFLELIPQEGAGLADPEEQRMASKEQATEAKMRSYLPGPGWRKEDRQPGDTKGKGKKGKGKYEDKRKEGKGNDKAEKAPAA